MAVATNSCRASDWEEDRPTPRSIQERSQDTVILDEPSAPVLVKPTQSHGQVQEKSDSNASDNRQTPLLQGSATAIRTRAQNGPASSSALAAQNAALLMEVARIDQDANRFLQQAEVNVVVQPSTFRAFLEKTHPGFGLAAGKDGSEQIVVVRGQWDDSSKPLHSLGLRFRPIKTKELADFSFEKCRVLIIDCAGNVPKDALQKIRDFVLHGGYLVSTDWTLQNVLEKSFPNYVQWNRDNTDGSITDAYVLDAANPLLQGIPGKRHTWKLDRMSQCISVVNPAKVKVLVRSSKMARVDPQLRVLGNPLLAGALATEFSFGRGKVLHLVGHFDNCANSFKPNLLPDPAPEIGLSLRQAITANFIVEGIKAHETAISPSEPINSN